MNKIFLFLPAFLSIFFCMGQEVAFTENPRDYFFPYKNFKKPVTYVYKSVADSTDKVTWVLKTKMSRKDTILTIKVSDSKDRLIEETTQKITKKNVVLLSFRSYKYAGDSVQISDCMILDSITYSFQQKPDEEISWRVQFTDKHALNPIILKKTRMLAGIETYSKTLKFADKYYFRIDDVDYLDHQVKSYYSKNKGLTEYSIIDRKALSKVYILEK